MDVTLSRLGDYVFRAAVDLAAAWSDGGYRKIGDVAESMDLPRSYTPHVLGSLARAGLAESKAGRAGGYRLSRAPGEISVLEVIEAAEGPLSVERCPMRGGPCRWDDVCAAHPTWVEATRAMRESLASSSLAELADADARLGRGERIATPPPGHRRPRRGRGGGPPRPPRAAG